MVYAVSGLCLVLLTGLGWKSQQSGSLFRKSLKLLFTFLAVASLWAAGVRPAIPYTKGEKSVLLLTEGSGSMAIDSLKAILKPDYMYRLMHDSVGLTQAGFIPNVEAILAPDLAVGKVHIAGFGLEQSSLEKLEGLEVSFHLNENVKGITEVYFDREITLGQEFFIEGKVNPEGDEPLWLVLDGPAGPLDSVRITGPQSFSFHIRPKLVGKSLYYLKEKKEEHSAIRVHPVPLLIKAPVLLNILALQNAPDFESRYLKKWLKAQGHHILWRTAISKEKYHDEFINRKRAIFKKLTKDFLKEIDLLMIDRATYNGLSAYEKKEIERAVKQEGMGVFLLSDEASLEEFNRFFGIKWHVKPEKVLASSPSSPKEMDAVPQFEFEKSALLQPLFTSHNTWWSATRPYGKGMAAVNLWNKTYRWHLKGKEKIYSIYWSTILSGASKKQKPLTVWKSLEMPVAGQKWRMVIRLSNEGTLEISGPEGDKFPLYGKQHPELKERIQAMIWPRDSGWYQLTVQGQKPAYQYVFTEQDWSSVKNARLIQFNRQWSKKKEAVLKTISFSEPEPLNLFWFYLIFLISSAALWLEMKW